MNDDAKRRADHRDRDDAAKEAKRMKKEEVEQIDEMPYQVYGSTDGKEEKKVGKPVKSRKYADARAAELEDTHKKTGGKYRSEYTKEEVTSLYDIVVGYLLDENLAIDEDHAVLVLPELTPEEVAYIVDEYTMKHGKKAMDWNRSDDKPKTVAKNPKMPKKKEGKCSCCGNDPCTC
jgi:hypothetical protein